MKIYNYFFGFVFILFFFSACNTPKRYYYDVNGNQMTEEAFLEKWGRQEEYYRWDTMIKDSARLVHMKKPQYKTLRIDHDIFLDQLESHTGKKFSNALTFLIFYEYRDDLCNINHNPKKLNKWNKNKLWRMRSFYKGQMEGIADENLILLVFYEEGILIPNERIKDKFLYKDKEGYFRQNIFKTPALCGSWAIIKPGGDILVQNGESTPERAAIFLQPKYWSKIFPQ